MISGVAELDDDDPEERCPAGRLLVPTCPGPAGSQTLRILLTAVGIRTAVGFTSRERLNAVMGSQQPYLPMAITALRTLLEPLAITIITVDPQLIARPPQPLSKSFATGVGALLTARDMRAMAVAESARSPW